MELLDTTSWRDSNTLCRTCLQVLSNDALDTSKHDIFLTPEVVKKLVLCTSLTVEPQDGYPKHLCDCCYAKVNEFHQFQTMCVESAQRFGEIMMSRVGAAGAGFHFEDEKPFCDFETTKLEVTFDESDALLQSEDVLLPLETDDRSTRKGFQKSKAPQKLKKRKPDKKPKKPAKIKPNDEWKKTEVKREGVIDEEILDNDEFNDDDFNDKDFSEEEDEDYSEQEEMPLSKLKKTIPRKRKKKSKNDSTAVFKCDQCPKYFMVERNLLGHKRIHDGLFPFPCPHEGCTKAYALHNRLNRHIQNSHMTKEPKEFPCTHPGCERIYKHRESLRAHSREHNKPVGYVPPQHICEICGKVFGKPAQLRDHLITHKDSSEYPFACNQANCTRRFAKKDKLKEHMMRHAGIKNFVCPHCGMRKTTQNELRTHINYHTLERRWPCKLCDHICNSSGNLKRHVRIVHEQARDFACRFCERKFGKKETLKHHEMTHTGEKPHECTECGKRFTQPTALKTHEKTHQRHQQQRLSTKTSKRLGVALAAAITPPANVVALISEAVTTAGLF